MAPVGVLARLDDPQTGLLGILGRVFSEVAEELPPGRVFEALHVESHWQIVEDVLLLCLVKSSHAVKKSLFVA